MLGLASCSSSELPPASPLTDGCYYANTTPVLRVAGAKGDLLVPGNIRQVTVERGAWQSDAWVIFRPAIQIQRNPLSATVVPDLDEIWMTMEPRTAAPTISTTTDEGTKLHLVRGQNC